MTPYKDPEAKKAWRQRAKEKAAQQKAAEEPDVLALRHVTYANYVWACGVLEKVPMSQRAWQTMRNDHQDHPEFRIPGRKR